jgi:hypothetical protein
MRAPILSRTLLFARGACRILARHRDPQGVPPADTFSSPRSLFLGRAERREHSRVKSGFRGSSTATPRGCRSPINTRATGAEPRHRAGPARAGGHVRAGGPARRPYAPDGITLLHRFPSRLSPYRHNPALAAVFWREARAQVPPAVRCASPPSEIIWSGWHKGSPRTSGRLWVSTPA